MEDDENTGQQDDFIGLSGAGRGAGTDLLTPEDLAPPTIPAAPIDPILERHLQDIGMGQPMVAPSSQSIKQLLHHVQVNGLDVAVDPFKMAKPIMGDFRNPDIPHQFIDRYAEHPLFNKLGFTPFRDNEKLYNQHSTTLDELSRAASQWLTPTVLGFKSMLGLPGDLSDPKVAREYAKAMAIGSSSKGGLGGFGTNLYLNSGYTIGILGELAMEEVIMAAGVAALATFEIPSLGTATLPMAALIARMGVRAGKGFSKIKDGFNAAKNLTKTLDNLQDMNKARMYFNKTARSMGRLINPLENTVDFFRHADKLKDLNGLQRTGHGFGAFYRDLRNAKAAYQEGALEAGMVQNNMERDFMTEFQSEHGRLPNREEAREIRETAYLAGKTTALWNSPVIFFSNKLTFDGLMRGRFVRMQSDVIKTGLGRKILFNPKKGLKEAYKKLPDNYFLSKWEYIKNPRLILQNFGKYNKANIAEGLQESAQETIAGASEDYYMDKYKGDALRGGYMKYMASNMVKQISPQGFETFMSGYLMGGFIAPVSNTVAAVTQGKAGFEGTLAGKVAQGVENKFMQVKYREDPAKYTEYKTRQEEIKAKREQTLNEDIDMLNELYEKSHEYFSPDLENMMEQKEYQIGMDIAQKNNDKKTYYDMKDSSLIKHITTAMKYDRLGDFVSNLENMRGFTPEELKSITEQSPEEFSETIDKTIRHAKNIESTWHMAQKKYANPFNPSKHIWGTPAYELEKKQQQGWEAAVNEMVFNGVSFTRALDRQKGILAKAKDIAGLKNTPYSEFNVLFGTREILEEISILKTELEGTEERKGLNDMEALTDDMRKLQEEKNEKLEKLEAFEKAITAVRLEVEGSDNESFSEGNYNSLKKAYIDYVTLIAGKHGDLINNDDLSESLDELIDYHVLGERASAANNAVNILLDPKAFIKLSDRITKVLTIVNKNRKAEIQKSLEEFRKLLDKNKMLNELFEAGMFFDVKDLIALEEEGIVPDTFYYHNAGESKSEVPKITVVKKGTPKGRDDYQIALGILRKYIDTLENIEITEEAYNPYSSIARPKDNNDTRTYEDLAKQFSFDPNAEKSTVKLKIVLEAIIKSDFATDREVALAEKMLEIADENEEVTFDKGANQPGYYSATEGVVIDARFNSNEYKQGRNGHPIEHVLLHEEVHRRTVDSLESDPEFKASVQALFNEAKAAFDKLEPSEKAFYVGRHDKWLYGLMNLEEFVAEAMSNDRFQQFLATVKSEKKTEHKSTWNKFVDLVLKQIESILKVGKKLNGTVLNATLELITAKIDQTYGEEVTAEVTVGKGLVHRTISVSELKSKHPELAKIILKLFRTANESLIKESTEGGEKKEALLEDIEKMSPDEIMDSVAFKSYLESPHRMSKQAAIIAYNKKITAEEPVVEPKPKPKPKPKKKGKKKKKTPSHINDEMKKELKKLGWSARLIKGMRPSEAQGYIDESITPEENKTRKEAKEEPDSTAVEAKRLRKNVEVLLNNVEDYEGWIAATNDIRGPILAGTTKKVRDAAGITAEAIDDMLKAKLDELGRLVEFKKIALEEVMVLNDKYESKVRVIKKDKNSITVEYVKGKPRATVIKKGDVKKRIKYKHSDVWNDPEFKIEDFPKPTEEEKEISKESVDTIADNSEGGQIKKAMDDAKGKSSKEHGDDLIGSVKKCD
jgi:hypothetical protein